MYKVELTEVGKKLIYEKCVFGAECSIIEHLKVQEFEFPWYSIRVPRGGMFQGRACGDRFFRIHMGPHYMWKAAEVN